MRAVRLPLLLLTLAMAFARNPPPGLLPAISLRRPSRRLPPGESRAAVARLRHAGHRRAPAAGGAQAQRAHGRPQARSSIRFPASPGSCCVSSRSGCALTPAEKTWPLACDAAGAHAALMNSPGHRANILDEQYNSIGIGVVRTLARESTSPRILPGGFPDASVERGRRARWPAT